MFSSGFTAIEIDEPLIDYQTSEIIAIASAYLEEATYASYFYTDGDFERMSIESLSDNEITILAQEISDYSTFRAMLNSVPDSDTKIASATMTAMMDNLSLHRKNVEYHAYLNELEGITYNYFTPCYNAVECSVDGNFASVNIYETLDFQYSDCEEPSMVITHYLVSLIKYEGE